MARQFKISKRYKEWGRKLRGSAKSRRNGAGKQRGKRKVWYEKPSMRCECHHSYPCQRAGVKA